MGTAASLVVSGADPVQQKIWDRLRSDCHGATPPASRTAAEAAALRDNLAAKHQAYLADSGGEGDAVAAADAAFARLKEDYIDACIGERHKTPLRGLDQVVDAVVYTSDGRWPLVWDPSGQAAKFFKYQGGVYLRTEDPRDTQPETMRAALVGCLQHGNPLAIDLGRGHGVGGGGGGGGGKQIFDLFVDTFFPREVLSRELLHTDDVVHSLLRPSKGDPEPSKFLARDEFRLVVISSADELPRLAAAALAVVEVTTSKSSGGAGSVCGSGASAVAAQEQEDMELQEAFGLREKVRNSRELVEAAFDGDVEGVRAWLAKDYHLESRDGQKATALSEACCAGKLECARFLLDQGAEPNTVTVTGRTPLFRAAFHGHDAVCQLLLESGADPDVAASDPPRPRRPQEVARTPALSATLAGWDRGETKFRMAARRKQREAALMRRCRSAAERAAAAKAQLRAELVALAVAGDAAGLAAQLDALAREAEELDERPRAGAQARDERGHTLLAIAAWKGHAAMAEQLCTHWLQYKCPEGSFLDENKALREAWRVDVDARNCQGWTPVALAAFHGHAVVVRALLAAGADPTKRNARRLSAFQLAASARRDDVGAVLREWGEDHQLGVHEMDTSVAAGVVLAGNPLAAVVSPSGTAAAAAAAAAAGGGAKKKMKKKKQQKQGAAQGNGRGGGAKNTTTTKKKTKKKANKQ